MRSSSYSVNLPCLPSLTQRGCEAGCAVTGAFVVPLTNVDFLVWETTDVWELEVQSGLSLLGQALGAVGESVSQVVVRSLITNNKSNILNLGQVLQSLQIKMTHRVLHLDTFSLWVFDCGFHFTGLSNDAAPAERDSASRKVTSLSELLSVHTKFLRGKVRLLLKNAPVCQQNST
ncbi:hypothetical protein DPEC_G00238540 [Dallia pectoralis]|uniref:Uncharacterized protein n=1 Tax=Dallia pectoralis TaxID=75939 RepID=A0ACC2FZ44_DALPE|nr:hypothetical protein DPEC_G00238540 [Dallia pectoralis]